VGSLLTTADNERKKHMNNEKRVLARQGAKELAPSEADHVVGGLSTLTVCTIPRPGTHGCDGDTTG
jgi:hypothetical protein